MHNVPNSWVDIT